MEEFQSAREKAKKNINVADHMLSVTYPLVKDPKILVAIVENIFLAYANSMSAILHYERLFKRIPPFQDNFESKLNTFKEKCVSRHALDKEYLVQMQEIRDILNEHKKSPVEFSRKEKFVICSDNYKMKTIELADLSRYINKAKVFIGKMDTIVSKNERIFR